MGIVDKSEKLVADILKSLKLPKLPVIVRKWLGDNLWWIALALAILSGIGALMGLTTLLGSLAALAVSSVFAVFVGWAVISSAISVIFSAAGAAVLGAAVKPLQLKQRQGWALFFVSWVLGALSTALSVIFGILSLNIIGAMATLIFGALWLGVYAYALFEVRSEFAHVEKSAGVKGKSAKVTKK